MKIRATLPVLGLCVLALTTGWLISPGLRNQREVLESDARTLVRLQEAHFLDFYGYTARPDRLGFEPQKHVLARIELSSDRLGWSSVLTDERRPGAGCAVFGGSVEGPLPSPGGAVPTQPGVPVCDPRA